ncbi:hypothetical protein GN316_16120 [Xylophilus sp. Kf1]|nr:hypothetical protein [Xylophilus sp. Kf1]
MQPESAVGFETSCDQGLHIRGQRMVTATTDVFVVPTACDLRALGTDSSGTARSPVRMPAKALAGMAVGRGCADAGRPMRSRPCFWSTSRCSAAT